MDERWDVVRSLAEDQHGVFTTAQVRRYSIDGGWLTRAERERRIGRMLRGAYGIPGLLDDWSFVMAAQLLQPRAVVGGTTAGALHGFDGISGIGCDLLVPPNRRVRGFPVRHTDDLVVPELVVIDGIRCTGEIRTLIDLGGMLSADDLERAVESYRRRPHADVPSLRDRAEALARQGRSGPPQLLTVLDRVPAVATESDLETVYWQLLRTHGVPLPERQVQVGPYRVDLGFSDIRLFIELDGWATHGGREAFGADRRRQNHLIGLGWVPLRFTDSDVRRFGRRTAWITAREVHRRRADLVSVARA